jgi:hypothetical protein
MGFFNFEIYSGLFCEDTNAKNVLTEPRISYRKRDKILSLFSKGSICSLPQEIIRKLSFDPQNKPIQAVFSQYLVIVRKAYQFRRFRSF